MVKIPDEVKKFLIGELAFVATVDAEGKPNVSAKGSLRVLDDESLLYNEEAGKKTYENLKKNPYIAVAVASRDKHDGYQIKGKAELLTKGPLYEEAVNHAEEYARSHGVKLPKPVAAVRVKADEIYSLKPPLGYKIA